MKTIYLLRHGEPDFPNGIRSCLGKTDLPLGDNGILQAEHLREYFHEISISHIYASTLKRAVQTAKIVADENYPVISVSELDEMDAGCWDGLSFEKIKKSFPEHYAARGINPALPPPDGEEFSHAAARMNNILRQLAEKDENPIVIVAHSGLIRSFLCKAMGLDYCKNRTLIQPYCGINMLFLEKNKWIVGSIGEDINKIPTVSQCKELYKKYGTPMKVQDHCLAVAKKAMIIGDNLIYHGVALSRGKLYISALLHDLARHYPHHPSTAAQWLRTEKLDSIADIVEQHHSLTPESCLNWNEASVVFLADKLIQGIHSVSVEKRFADSLKKCVSENAKQAHQKQYDQATLLWKKYCKIVKKENYNETVTGSYS